ncbi:MAG: helix-turn-helix transcriptional regulator [Lewinellaceae bacterium]|nr:helix-turn-helix transcriptional regulator [Lewinellaceae bacterium]
MYIIPDGKPGVKFSTFLSEKLKKRYGYLANSFVEAEDTTIEQYLVTLKIERVKELIIFGEHTLSQIAFKLHYSSVAHLSKQFKKMTGLTPSEFRAIKKTRKAKISKNYKYF